MRNDLELILRTLQGRKHEPQRITRISGGFKYCNAKGIDHTVIWADVLSISWYEPPYGPLGSVPYWSIITREGVLEVEDWLEGADELLELFIGNLRGFRLPPKAYEYAEQPTEGHLCWNSAEVGYQNDPLLEADDHPRNFSMP